MTKDLRDDLECVTFKKGDYYHTCYGKYAVKKKFSIITINIDYPLNQSEVFIDKKGRIIATKDESEPYPILLLLDGGFISNLKE